MHDSTRHFYAGVMCSVRRRVGKSVLALPRGGRDEECCASKGGFPLLPRDLAVKLGSHGITVNGIAPGAIATEIDRTLLDDKPRVERLLAQIPLGRMGKPEDVAAFLASPDADSVAGSMYDVDGGLAWDHRE